MNKLAGKVAIVTGASKGIGAAIARGLAAAGAPEETTMNEGTDPRALRIALVVVGVTFVIGLYPLTIIWPAGWIWHGAGERHAAGYLQMMFGVYATLGVFLILAARDPLKNLSLIWFTVWVNVVHGGIMGLQALVYLEHRPHLVGDVPALLVIALVLGVLTPRGEQAVRGSRDYQQGRQGDRRSKVTSERQPTRCSTKQAIFALVGTHSHPRSRDKFVFGSGQSSDRHYG